MDTSYIDVATWNVIRDRAVLDAESAVEAALVRFGRSGLRADGTVPSGLEGPKALILDEAERWKADLIVAGAHGYNTLDRLLLGSVSEALALYAKCSVEVIREKRVRPVLQTSEVAKPAELFMKSPGVAIASGGGA
jgi:nucleotide-binding universal stress UspA family protein